MTNPIIQRSRIERRGLATHHKQPDVSPLIEKLISCAAPIRSSMQISTPCMYANARRNFIQLPSASYLITQMHLRAWCKKRNGSQHSNERCRRCVFYARRVCCVITLHQRAIRYTYVAKRSAHIPFLHAALVIELARNEIAKAKLTTAISTSWKLYSYLKNLWKVASGHK